MSSPARARLRDERALLAVLAGVAVVVRAAWALYAARTPQGLHDPGLYRFLAGSLSEGDGYAYPDGPTAYYPVGYPAALGAAFWLFRHTPLPGGDRAAIVVLNLACAAVAVVATYALGRRLLSRRRAIVATLIVALLPNLVFHGAVALSEPLFLALLIPAVVLLLEPGERRRLVAAGALLGLAVLVRPVAAPLLAVLPVAWTRAGLAWRPALLRAAAVAGVAALVVAPWIVRNAVVVDSATLSTNTGDNLCMSRQPGATGAFLLSDHCHGADAGLTRPASETARDAAARRLAIDFVRDDPLRELSLWPRRVGAAFAHDHEALRAAESYGDDPFLPGGVRRGLQLAAAVAFFGVLGAAVAALPWWWRSGRRDGSVLLVLGFVAVVIVPVVVFFGEPRFHVPGVPFLAVLAAGLAPPAIRP